MAISVAAAGGSLAAGISASLFGGGGLVSKSATRAAPAGVDGHYSSLTLTAGHVQTLTMAAGIAGASPDFRATSSSLAWTNMNFGNPFKDKGANIRPPPSDGASATPADPSAGWDAFGYTVFWTFVVFVSISLLRYGAVEMWPRVSLLARMPLPEFLIFPNAEIQAASLTYVGVASACGAVIAGGTPSGLGTGLAVLFVYPLLFLSACAVLLYHFKPHDVSYEPEVHKWRDNKEQFVPRFLARFRVLFEDFRGHPPRAAPTAEVRARTHIYALAFLDINP